MQRLADELSVEQTAQALHRLHRPRRARREDQDLPRPRLQPPGVPRARPGPGEVPAAVRRGDPARGCATLCDAASMASRFATLVVRQRCAARCAGPATASRSTPTEAEILLGARGDALDDLLRVGGAGARPGAGRRRPSRRRHLLAQGLHPADPAVPRPLPLLHVRDDAEPRRRRRSCRRTRCSRSPTQGAALGCKEALFTLGDRPEDRWPAAREWLDAHGYDSTLAYVRAMAIRVLEETGLLPHLNPGVMSWAELQRLKPVAPSMGMMLETTSRRLFEDPRGAHFGSPDKDPAVRLRVLEDAGRIERPVHHRHPDRHRRDARRAGRLAVRDPPGRPRVRRDPGSHRPELPRQARHRDGAHARRRARTTSPRPSPSPGWCSARACASRRRRT